LTSSEDVFEPRPDIPVRLVATLPKADILPGDSATSIPQQKSSDRSKRLKRKERRE